MYADVHLLVNAHPRKLSKLIADSHPLAVQKRAVATFADS